MIAHVANILQGMGEGHGRRWRAPLQRTIVNAAAEVDAAAYPVAAAAYHRSPAPEAARVAAFRNVPIPGFLDQFQAAKVVHPGDRLTDHRWIRTDASLFRQLEGMFPAFPRRSNGRTPHWSALMRRCEQVPSLTDVRDNLATDRRLPFNWDAILNDHPEPSGA